MKISQLAGESEGFVVPSIRGVIDKVWPATEPSAAQTKAGIHRQNVYLKQGGDKVSVTLLKESMHLTPDAEGKTYMLDSTKDEKGMLKGVEVSHWDKAGEQQTGLDVWGQACFYPVDTPDEVEPTELTTPQVTPQAASKASKGHIARFMRLHHACFTIASLEYEGEGLSIGELKDIATSGTIKFDRNPPNGLGEEIDAILGLNVEVTPVTNVVRSQASHEVVPAAEPTLPLPIDPLVIAAKETFDATEYVEVPWKKCLDDDGNIIHNLGREELIDLLIKVLPTHNSEDKRTRGVLNAAIRSKNEIELTFADIYDVFEVVLQNDYSFDAIGTAYKQLDNTFDKVTEDTCKNILFDQDLFKEMIATPKS